MGSLFPDIRNKGEVDSDDDSRYCPSPPELPDEYKKNNLGSKGSFATVSSEAAKGYGWETLQGPAALRAKARAEAAEKNTRVLMDDDCSNDGEEPIQPPPKSSNTQASDSDEDEFSILKKHREKIDEIRKIKRDRILENLSIGPPSHERREQDASDILEKGYLNASVRSVLADHNLKRRPFTKRHVLEPYLRGQRQAIGAGELAEEEKQIQYDEKQEHKEKRKNRKLRQRMRQKSSCNAAKTNESASLADLPYRKEEERGTAQILDDAQRSLEVPKQPAAFKHKFKERGKRGAVNKTRKVGNALKHGILTGAKLLSAAAMTASDLDDNKDTILAEAVELGNKLFLKLALDAGAEINQNVQGQPVFLYLFEVVVKIEQKVEAPSYFDPMTGQLQGGFGLLGSYEKCMNLSIEYGANPTLFEDNEDDEQRSSIHVAAQHGSAQRIKWLASEFNVDANQRSKGLNRTPLMVACEKRHLHAVVTLIKLGADIFATDACGMTALHWAGWKGARRVAKVLLSCGADRDAKDVSGYTAADLAKQGRKKTTADFIRTYRAAQLSVPKLLVFWEQVYKAKYHNSYSSPSMGGVVEGDEATLAESHESTWAESLESTKSLNTHYSRFDLSFEAQMAGRLHGDTSIDETLTLESSTVDSSLQAASATDQPTLPRRQGRRRLCPSGLAPPTNSAVPTRHNSSVMVISPLASPRTGIANSVAPSPVVGRWSEIGRVKRKKKGQKPHSTVNTTSTHNSNPATRFWKEEDWDLVNQPNSIFEDDTRSDISELTMHHDIGKGNRREVEVHVEKTIHDSKTKKKGPGSSKKEEEGKWKDATKKVAVALNMNIDAQARKAAINVVKKNVMKPIHYLRYMV